MRIVIELSDDELRELKKLLHDQPVTTVRWDEIYSKFSIAEFYAKDGERNHE